MKEQDFENPHLTDRFQQSQPPIEQDFCSQNRRTSNQNSRSLDNSVNYIQPPQPMGQLPVEHIVNFNQQRQLVVQLPVDHTVNFNQRQQAVQLPVEHINHNRQRQQAVQFPVEQTDNYSRSNTRAIQLLGGHTVTNTQPTQQPIQQSTQHTISNIPHQPEGTSVSSRQLPTHPGFNRSPPTIVNQPVNHRATGQQPPQPTVNRSNPLPAHRSTPPVREREPCQQPPPTVNRANQPPCPRSTGQLQSTSQQNYTAGRQNYSRVIDNQQHQPPISHPVHIPHISSQVPPTQQFINRAGQHQPNTNQSGFQQPLINTMGQQGQPPLAIHNQQEVYRQQPVQHLHNVTAPQGRPHQPSTTQNLAQGTAQSGYYGAAPHLPVYPQQQQLYNNQPQAQFQDQRSISSVTSCSNSDSDSSSTTSGVVYRRSRHKSRSHKTHSRHSISSRHVSPVEEEVSDHSSPHHKSSGKKHVKGSQTDMVMPKNLKYTGKGNWKAFYTKFTGYAEAAGWTDKQKREQLCWCLEDKASDFYTVLLESNKDIAFSTVVTKMVKRFGFQEPQETSQIQFQTITQKKEESLEDWADRVLSLATQSFKDLSEEYMTKQAVMKFCQGCNDPEAGQHACGFKPVSVENAIDIIKWFQHSRKAVQAHIAQGKTPEVKQASAPTPTAQVSDTPSVHGVGSSKSAIDTRVSQMEQQLRQQREEQQQSMQQMQSLLSSMATVPVQDNDFVIEPNSKTTLLIPRSVCAKGQSPVVCFMNVTDNPVRLQGGIEVAEAHAVTVIESMDDPQELSVGTCSTSKQDEAVPLARKRKQKPRLLKRVATAMMMLFETPEKVSTLEQPAVPVESAVMEDCCHTSSLNSIEPIASQSSEECDLPPFSTGMELIFTPSTARIVMDDSSDCVVAAIAQEEGITISGFSEEDIKTGQESDLDLMFILPYLKDGCEPLSNDLFLAPPAAKSHWINKERFFLDDNGILKSQPKTEGANTRLVVPASLRQTSFRLCSSEGSEEEERSWRPSSCDSQPGVGIQPFDMSLLDQATHREKVRMEEPGQEGPVDHIVLLEVPAIPEYTPEETKDEVPPELKVEAVEQSAPVAASSAEEVSVSGEQEIPVPVDSMETLAITDETLVTPEETEVPAAWEEQSAPVPASLDSLAFKREIPAAWKGSESQVWTGPYSGFKERTWSVSDRDVDCPVPECPVITWHLREHALTDHLSPMFESNFSREVMTNQGFHRFRGHMGILLARWLTGREIVTSAEFVSWLQQRAVILRGCKIQGLGMPPLCAVCLEASSDVIAVAVLSVTPEVQLAPQEKEERVTQNVEEKRVTPPVEEPVAVATTPSESFGVLIFQNTRKLCAVTSVNSAVTQAKELFDLEYQQVVLTYLEQNSPGP
ncbi:unnamed protein product [Mytilus edulis]|uniref:Paraneoplastic antigen Ma-like C-terminal domain-containing protein n=1 Tax=Mytilus edulis TaxID=6550 RepID=A0A8S3SH58_MYTED|nr:unnamed protein product [Mytilus edulis]